MKKQILAASLLALAAFTGHAQAQSNAATPQPLRFFLGGGFTFGGDKLVTVPFNDGTKDDITAGGLAQLNAGVHYQISDNYSASLALGYHADSTAGTNGSVSFTRYPVELLGYYAVTPVVRIGGGVRLIGSAKLRGTGVKSGISADYGSTNGVVLEGEYLMSSKLGIKLRLVDEKYKINGAQNKIDGSHAGVLFNFYF
jgi:hypothetical protein